jgi:hypothetical protein
LEHAVLAALRLCCGAPAREPVAAGPIPADGARRGVSQASSIECWRSIWTHLDQSLDGEFDSIDWFRDYDADLPCDAALDAVERHADALFAGLAQADVELLAVRSRVVCAGRFNQLLEQRGNKANVLSHTTLELLAELLEPLDEGAIRIHCDKHGGRNRYAPLLQQTFPEHLIEVHCESRAESLYRWGPRERRVEIHFTAGGEAALPAALASMTSKYLRELAMRAFNDFWVREVPGIRPTAGYPVDAQRFRKAIAARQAELAIEDCVLWRNK